MTKYLHLAVLAFLIFAVFANTLSNGFVWDDSYYLLKVGAYRNFDLHRFFLGLGNGVEYLPVRDLSYALDFTLWGENPAGFHATNLILFILNVLAVYLLSETAIALLCGYGTPYDCSSPRIAAFWSAAIFALHPIHCETLNFIAGGRNTLLAGLFSFLAARFFICFLGKPDRSGLTDLSLSLCLYVIAVLSKATSVTLPLFFVLLCIIFKRRPPVQRALAALLFIAAAAAISRIHWLIAVSTGVEGPPLPLAQKIAVSLQIPFFYLEKLIYPVELSVDYSVSFPSSLSAPTAIAAMIALLLLTTGAYRWRNRASSLFLTFSWYLVLLLPVLQLFSKPMIVADRYAYIPSFALIFLTALWGVKLASRFPRPVFVAGVAVLCLLGSISFRQNRVWASDFDLWEHTLSVSPRSNMALTNQGTYYFLKGNYARAFELFDQARKVEPRNPSYDFFEGLLFYVRGNFPEAKRSFGMALARKGNYIDALYHMACTNEALKDYPAAVEYYRRTLASLDADHGDYKRMAAQKLETLDDFR